MATPQELDERLKRMEAQLAHLTALLERGAAPNGSPVDAAVAQASKALDATYGEKSTPKRLSEFLLRLGDPETLDSLSRIVTLLPQLEYALQGVAAGPELVDEALEMVREKLGGAEGAFEARRRLEALLEAGTALTRPKVVESLGRLAQQAGSLATATGAASQALEQVVAQEGVAHLQGRLSEAVVRLTDEDTLGALVRIATLAPDLEYAVNAVAAAPVLVDEALALLRVRLAAHGVDSSSLEARVERSASLLLGLTEPKTASAVAELTAALPKLTPVLRAASEAGTQLAADEGAEALTARLSEALVRVGSPEVLDALVRVATLVPDLEYAVNGLAAGPVLLDEGLALVRQTMERSGGGAEVDVRLRAATTLLLRLSEPATLHALTQAIELLPALLPLAEVSRRFDLQKLNHALEAFSAAVPPPVLDGLIGVLPKLRPVLEALPAQSATLNVLTSLNRAVAESSNETGQLGLFGLLGAMGDPNVQRAAAFGVAVARRLGKSLESGHAQLPAGRA